MSQESSLIFHGLAISDRVAFSSDGTIVLLGDDRFCDTGDLDALPEFRRGVYGIQDRPGVPCDNRHTDIIVNSINLGLAFGGARLVFRGWCNIRTFVLIERIYGEDSAEQNCTIWYTTGPRDPGRSSTGEVYELTPSEDPTFFHGLFWEHDPLDDVYGIVGILYEIVLLEPSHSGTPSAEPGIV